MDKSELHQVLFDLDGTLIDHFEAIHEGYLHAQTTLGLPTASLEKVKATVGGSVPVTMRRLIGEDASDETIDRAIALFDERFSEIMLDLVTVLPWVPELLDSLQRIGIPMAVFTNKKGEHARSVLKHLGLDGYFGTIAGAGDTPYRKPDPEFTDWVLKAVDSSAEGTLMIGDSPFDVEAGKVRGLKVAVVATGSHSTQQLAETEADWVFTDMGALGAELFGVSPNRPGDDA